MSSFHDKLTGWSAVIVGIAGVLAVVALILFFVGLFQNNHSLASMGRVNDILNAVTGILSAVLASLVHPFLKRYVPRLSLALLTGVWFGAFAITDGSWLIITDRAGVELSSHYYFFGNGLIGVWLWNLNRIARAQSALPRNLTQWGLIAGSFMMVGLLSLYGILRGLDRTDYSPLILVTGISFLGIGIFYPIWCLLLGRWILSKRSESFMAATGAN